MNKLKAKIICFFTNHDDKRIASIGGIIEVVKCRRCERLALREY